MAASDLQIKVGADLSELKAALAGALKDVRAFGAQARKAVQGAAGGGPGGPRGPAAAGAGGGLLPPNAKAGVTAVRKEVDGIRDGFDRARQSAGRLFSGLAAVAGIGKLIAIGDEMTTLNGRLRLATNSAEEFNRAQGALFDLAQRSRSGLSDTVKLFTSIALATKDSAVGQETLIGVVETINQAVAISGSSADSARAALVQLGQGLSSGTLRGEELNSVLEQTPALAQAIATGMGITRGELRKYGEQGKITAEQVIIALQKQSAQVAADFAKLPITVGQALTQVNNSFLRFVGLVDGAAGATAGLARGISAFASFLGSGAFLESVTRWITILQASFSAFGADVARTLAPLQGFFSLVGTAAAKAAGFVARAFLSIPLNVRTSMQIAAVQFFGLFDRLIAGSALVRDSVAAIFNNDTVSRAVERFNKRVEGIGANVAVGVEAALAENAAAIAAGDAAAAKLAKSRADALKKGAGTGTGRPAKGKDDGKTFTGPVVDAFEIAKLAAQRGIAEVEELYKSAALSLREFLDRRVELQTQAIDAEIEQERRKLREAIKGRKQEEANRAATNIERLRQERDNVIIDSGREQLRAARDIADQRVGLEAQRLEQTGQLEAAALLRLRLQYRDTLARLQVEGDAAGIALVNGIINTEASKARFAELRAQFERVQDQLQARTQSVADQRSSGTLGFGQAETAQAEARAAATTQLQALNAQFQELATRTNDPAIVAGAQAVTQALRQIEQEGLSGLPRALQELRGQLTQLQKNAFTDVARAGTNATSQFFADISSGTVSASEAIRNFARNFVSSLAQIAAQALATRAILALLGMPAFGGGSLLPISAFSNHSGGMAGTGPKRSAPAWAFAGAPRLHSGLKADEVPAILQLGEEVLSRGDPKNSANNMGGGAGVRIVNVIDPELVNEYMQSASGERTIVNTIQRNRGQIKQALG